MRRSRFSILEFRFSIAPSFRVSSGRAADSPEISSAERHEDRAACRNLRSFLVCAGIALLALIWFGPLPGFARYAFAAHMLMHMGVVALAAPLLALGIAGSRFDLARTFPRLFAPIQASIVELVIVWAWHAPVLHHAARHHLVGLVGEQLMFFSAGLFLWLSAVGGDPVNRTGRTAAGIVGLLLTAMHMTLLGALLALSPRPLYAHMEGFSGLSALDDQHLGGTIMLLVGGVAYLLGGLGLTVRLLRTPHSAARGNA